MTAPWKSHIGFKKEATWGTPLAPDTWVPHTSATFDDERRREVDKGMRGRRSMDFAAYDGTHSAKPQYDFHYYPDECARFFARFLGSDAVSGAGPYVHTAKLLGSTPPSDTISDFYGIAASERRFPGAILERIDVHIDAMQGLIDIRCSWASWAPGAGNAESTPTFGSDAAPQGWQTILKLNGAANAHLLSADLTFQQAVNLVFAASNSQDPGFVEVGPVEITGKAKFYTADDSEYTLYRNNTQQSMEIIATRDATGILDLLSTKMLFEKVVPDRTGQYVTWDATLRALDNATDNGPMQVITTNNIAAAY